MLISLTFFSEAYDYSPYSKLAEVIKKKKQLQLKFGLNDLSNYKETFETPGHLGSYFTVKSY